MQPGMEGTTRTTPEGAGVPGGVSPELVNQVLQNLGGR